VVPTPTSNPSPDFDDEDGWPDPPVPSKLSQVVDDVALQVMDLLDSKHIPYDILIDGIDGIISANSYDQKELLKSSGFRWSRDTKRWVFSFTNEPF
jgi:hypothetical protein